MNQEDRRLQPSAQKCLQSTGVGQNSNPRSHIMSSLQRCSSAPCFMAHSSDIMTQHLPSPPPPPPLCAPVSAPLVAGTMNPDPQTSQAVSMEECLHCVPLTVYSTSTTASQVEIHVRMYVDQIMSTWFVNRIWDNPTCTFRRFHQIWASVMYMYV